MSAMSQDITKVETMGLEPTTPCLQSRCSSQLSYVPENARRGQAAPSLARTPPRLGLRHPTFS
jgi:hypothetical protein